MTGSARETILSRIRAALENPATATLRGRSGEEGAMASPKGAGVGIPREYRRTGSRSRSEVLSLFEERVSDYRATVFRCPASELSRAVARALQRRGVRRLVVPADLEGSWLDRVPDGTLEMLRDGEEGRSFTKGQIASCHGVLSGCAVGIAETGTIVLDAGPGQGRRVLSLLPDYHLCVVFGEQVVETVPEAVRDLAPVVAAHGRPLTLVSGPSATSDIELVRVEGVHGPRNLEVILVEEPR